MEGYPGLDAVESDGYRRLVTGGPVLATEFVAWFDDTMVDVPGLMHGLESKGLVFEGEDGRLHASPPNQAFARLIVSAEESLARARAEMDSLARAYKVHTGEVGLGSIVEVLQGDTVVDERVRALMLSATSTIHAAALGIDFDEVRDVHGYPEVVTAVNRGVEHLMVIDRDTLSRPNFKDDLSYLSSSLKQVRVADYVPTRMMIVDGHTAVLPMLSNQDSRNRVLIVHESPLVQALNGYFRATWVRSAQLVRAEDGRLLVGDQLDPGDIRLVSLLMSGVTDQAIAHQLSLSIRTVQRRVHALMDMCGATTRLQLGYEAGRRGWLPRHRMTNNGSQPPLG